MNRDDVTSKIRKHLRQLKSNIKEGSGTLLGDDITNRITSIKKMYTDMNNRKNYKKIPIKTLQDPAIQKRYLLPMKTKQASSYVKKNKM